MVGIIGKLGIDVLFTCVPEAEVEKVYSKSRLPKLTTISNLTGYVPTSLVRRRVGSIASRPIDVGYRGRTVPYWLGKLGAEKWQIAPRFLEATKGAGLNCDIAIREEDRIYGRRWIRFIASCKATLGVESGASVFDFDGSIRRAVEDHVAANPLASFEEVESRFLRQHEGRIRLNQISPRCFEAAALRTAMVLFEGEYSGVLQPWKHYIPLRKDFSNIDEVVAAIKDASMLQSLADAAYRDVALDPRWSYEAFTRRFDDALQVAHGAKRQALRPKVSRLGFAAVVLPAALLALLLRLWLSVPNGLRAQLRPAIRPLVAALRR